MIAFFKGLKRGSTDETALGNELFQFMSDFQEIKADDPQKSVQLKKAQLSILRKKLQNNFLNLEWRNESGDTALIAAVRSGEAAIVEELLMAKADINALDRARCTPLYIAVANGNLALVSLLIKHEADPSILPAFQPITDKASPLICRELISAISSHTIQQALAAAHPQQMLEEIYGLPLQQAFERLNPLVKIDRVEIDDRRKRINKLDQLGMSALMWAAHFNRVDEVAKLIHRGASLDMVHPLTTLNPLALAVKAGHKEVVKLLLLAGARPDVGSEKGTALKLAAAKNNISIRKYLTVAYELHSQLDQLIQEYLGYLKTQDANLEYFKKTYPNQLYQQFEKKIDQALIYVAGVYAASQQDLEKTVSMQKLSLYNTIILIKFNTNELFKKSGTDGDDKDEPQSSPMSPRSDNVIQELVATVRARARRVAVVDFDAPPLPKQSSAPFLQVATTREPLSPVRVPTSPSVFHFNRAISPSVARVKSPELRQSNDSNTNEFRQLLEQQRNRAASASASATTSAFVAATDSYTSGSENIKPTVLFSQSVARSSISGLELKSAESSTACASTSTINTNSAVIFSSNNIKPSQLFSTKAHSAQSPSVGPGSSKKNSIV